LSGYSRDRVKNKVGHQGSGILASGSGVRPNKKNTWLASPPASRFSAASEFFFISFYVNLFVLQRKTV
jgi:hypothetical protein